MKISYIKALHIIQHVHKRALKLILIIKLHHDFFKVINLIRPEKKEIRPEKKSNDFFYFKLIKALLGLYEYRQLFQTNE